MKAAVQILGIKCDNPECDFEDESVSVENYQAWVNKPCPKCSQNLLTQADFESTLVILEAVKVMNEMMPEQSDDHLVYTTPVEMNGSGEVKFSEPKFDGILNLKGGK